MQNRAKDFNSYNLSKNNEIYIKGFGTFSKLYLIQQKKE